MVDHDYRIELLTLAHIRVTEDNDQEARWCWKRTCNGNTVEGSDVSFDSFEEALDDAWETLLDTVAELEVDEDSGADAEDFEALDFETQKRLVREAFAT